MVKFLDKFFGGKGKNDDAGIEERGASGAEAPSGPPPGMGAQTPARPGMPMGAGPDLEVKTDIDLPDPESGSIKDQVILVLQQLYDPEIPVNIYELGLIYDVEVDDDNNVKVTMTLTSPHCPVAESLPLAVQDSIAMIEGVNEVDVEITWEPPWDFSMMTDEARLELGMM